MNKIKDVEHRFYTIDIIRGLAALSVLLTHWGGLTEKYADQFTKKIILILQVPINLIWQGGGTHPGVVIFIVLSGFCIHLSVEKNIKQIKNKYFWKIYYLRRSIRIYPVSVVSG
jgi:peptidoglycan/LPS O-acetylase OafA/YrhL